MMKKLFLAWKDPKTREWSTVGQLTHANDLYAFEYTKGALTLENFKPFGQMRDLRKRYVSSHLFPIFSNRILAKGRPEYVEYLNWLGMKEDEYNAMDELSLTGGLRATDNLEIFPCPQPTPEGQYKVTFFCRGLRHLHEENIARSSLLKPGEELFLMTDGQNKKDKNALLLRSDDPITLIGYTPRYFSSDFSSVIKHQGISSVSIKVDQINTNAPLQYKIRCQLECAWPAGFEACSADSFQSAVNNDENIRGTPLNLS